MAMGMSGAPFTAQATSKFMSDYYSRRFAIYSSVYLDDFWAEKSSLAPNFEEFAGEFGFRFKTSKTEEGSFINLLGVDINLADKTARITADKADNIEKDARLMLRSGKATSKQLAIFYGRLEFSAQLCKVGRIHTRALTLQMGDGQLDINNLSDQDEIFLSLKSLEEIRFWSSISKQDPLVIGRRKFTNGAVMASDASGKKWAHVIGNASYADVFPDDIKDQHISVKEAFALNQLMKKACEPDTDFEILCDNVATVHCFNKGRSKNEMIHNLVSETQEMLGEVNSRLRVVWISTAKMTEYADGPSRGVYKKDPFSLTNAGINRIIEMFPSFQTRRQNRDLVSLFAGPLNNPAQVRYFSLDIDATDPLSAGLDAFQAMDKQKAKGKKLAGGLLAYPPLVLIDSFNKKIRELGLEEDTEIYYVLPAKYVGKTVNMLTGLGAITVRLLCGKSNQTVLCKKQSFNMSIINIKSYDLQNRRAHKRARVEEEG